jgi:hypothetical protein
MSFAVPIRIFCYLRIPFLSSKKDEADVSHFHRRDSGIGIPEIEKGGSVFFGIKENGRVFQRAA